MMMAIKADWKTYRIGELYESSSGLSKARSEFGFGDPFLTFSEVFWNTFLPDQLQNLANTTDKEQKSCSIEEGDIFLTRTSETRHELGMSSVALKDYPKATFNGFTKRLRLKTDCRVEIDPVYIAYYLRSQRFRDSIYAHSSMTTRASLNNSAIYSLELLIPPLDTQIDIGQCLKSIDDLIRVNEQTNQTLESIAQALFQSWFVNFDPVRAKAAAIVAGEDPQLAAMHAISGHATEALARLSPEQYNQLAATADLFPDALIETEEGEIPEGWEWRTFGDFIDKTIGGDWGKETPDEDHTQEVAIIRGTDIPTLWSGGIEKVPTRFVQPKKYKSRSLQVGDIVLEVSGGSKNQPTGRSLIVTQNILERLGNDAVPASFCRLMRASDYHASMYLAQHLSYIYGIGKTWLYQNQSTGISNFQTQHFLTSELLPFAPKVISAFADVVAPLVEQITANESLKLAEIRDTLLPKLLSGEIELNAIK